MKNKFILLAVLGGLLLPWCLTAQKTVTGCEQVSGVQAELAANFTVTASGNFINEGTVHYSGVTSFTNDGGVSEASDASCIAQYASPCGTPAGVAGANIFNNNVASTTIQGLNPVRMYAIDIDRNIQLDNEWQVVSGFTFTSGMVTTDRTDVSHFLNLMDGAAVSGNGAASHVDGYAAYSGNGAFTLPIGDGSKELPAAVVGDCASVFKAAYFSTDPNAATLPTGAPFSTASFEAALSAVSTVEYWDVDGATATTITLSFDATSNLSALAADLNDISIAGWDGTEWIDLGSTASTGTIGAGGTITSMSVIPDTYMAYTFAAKATALQLKVMLQGALVDQGSGLMRDDLRSGGYLPLTEPYTALGNARFTHQGGGGAETTTAGVLAANAGTPDAIVDWVFVELRDASASGTVLETRAALVQRDGDVVEASDGVTALNFAGFSGQQYFVAVKHRNHLGVMTANAVTLSNSVITVVDFTTSSGADLFHLAIDYDGHEQVSINGVEALWAGNASADNKVKYQGPSTDAAVTLLEMLTHPNNTTPVFNFDNGFGYYMGDVNMDGRVKYQGVQNDVTYIFLNVVTYPLNGVPLYNFDFLLEQLP